MMFQELWKQEYERGGIPSSFRVDPTKVVMHFLSFLKERGFEGSSAIDLGAGKGRNSFYLAQNGFSTFSIEWLQENVNEIKQKAANAKLPISAYCQSVSAPWPIPSDSMDIAIDIFCYKHVVDKEQQKNYRKELYRALKPNGYYLLSLAADDDGFYGSFLKEPSYNECKLIIDPYSQIPSLLYSLEEIVEEFSDFFTLIQGKREISHSPMYGKDYQRSVLNLIFQKKI